MNNPLESLPQNEWDALIYSIVKPFYYLCNKDTLLTAEDLQQEAWLGLLAACEKYDPTRENKFQTFAYCYIRGHILRFVGKRTLEKPNQLDIDAAEIDLGWYVDDLPDRNDMMDTILDNVDQDQEHLLFEHFVRGKSLRQISREIGVSHETVTKRMHKILDLLQVRLNHANS